MPPEKQPTRSKASRKQTKPRNTFWQWNHIHLTFFLLGITLLLSCFLGVMLFLFLSLNIPQLTSLAGYRPPVTTLILDDQNEVVERLYRENRTVIPLTMIPDTLRKAFIAAEDARFHEHSGVDAWSILRALVHNIRSGDRGQGGSTITQQVARSLLLSPEKTYTRKVKEAILAYRIDSVFTKDEILFLYLNQIYFGEGAYGIEAAAQTYFDKAANQLNLAEIALLGGLPQAPSRYSPFKNLQLAKKRQAYVLNRMAEEGYISPTEARQAYDRQLLFKTQERQRPEEQYFLQHVKNVLTRQYGLESLKTGGFTIKTTLNRSMQKNAAEAIDKGIALWAARHSGSRTVQTPEAALLAIEIATGHVKAMMGGTNFARSQFNRAIQAKRQPGSAFKPIIYATALAGRFNPASIILDESMQLQGAVPGIPWEPRNFDGKHNGPTTFRNGLVHSNNIVTIKILQEIGIPAVKGLAYGLGIKTPLASNLSLALGASDLSLLELTNAYTVFADKGDYREPIFITRIIDRDGKILKEQRHSTSRRVMEPATAYQMTHLLSEVIADGTGRKARGLAVAAAGKTGTTDGNRDAWFIGYTPDLAAGVWLGYDQKKSLGDGENGARAAAPIWLGFMKQVRGYTTREFDVPDDIEFLPMNPESGEIQPEGNEIISWQPFKKGKPFPVLDENFD